MTRFITLAFLLGALGCYVFAGGAAWSGALLILGMLLEGVFWMRALKLTRRLSAGEESFDP